MAQTYDSYKKTCKNGYPQYYGVTIDPVTGVETSTEMNGSDWIASGQAAGYESLSLGCPSSGSITTYKPPRKHGAALVRYNRKKGTEYGLKKSGIDKGLALLPMITTMLAYLKARNVGVKDENNIFEVAAKYANAYPNSKMRVDSNGVKAFLSQNKNRLEMFDVGAIFSGVGSIITEIVNAASEGNVNAFLSNWSQAFDNYMRTDFAAIQETLEATQENPGPWGGWGPKGALDMLKQYKRTSWQDLRNTIEAYCQQHGKDIPDPVKRLWEAQDKLEDDLRELMDQQGTSGTQTPSGGGGGDLGGNNTIRPQAGGDIMKYIPWIVGALLFGFVIYLAFFRKAKKS